MTQDTNLTVLPLAPPSIDDRPYRRFGVLVLLLTFGIFGGWSATAPLGSAVIAIGQVKVESRRKTIQHLEGGIVDEIAVKDGDVVKEGQVLIRLSDVMARAQLEIAQVQYYEALGLEARLKAEQQRSNNIEFPAILREKKQLPNIAEILRGQSEVFDARRRAQANEKKILNQRIEQLRKQIGGLQGVIKAEQTRIRSYREEVGEWEQLYKEKLADKLRLLQIKRELSQLEGDEANNTSEMARLEIQIGETESQLVLREQQLLTDTVEDLRKTQAQIADLRTRMVALEDTLARTIIRSPVRGVVLGLSVHTIGAILSRGTPILEILPLSDDFVVEAMIRPTDIDKVQKGLDADLRFSAFNVRMTHVISGKVQEVSADAFQDQKTGTSYYAADIRLTPEGLQRMKEYGFQLVPGMPAEVVINIGERTVLEYLMKPITDMFARAFREE